MNGSQIEHLCFNSLTERVEMSYLQSISIGALLSCLSPIIACTNSILCIALLKTKQYKNHSQRFVIILAISDLAVGCFSVPFLAAIFTVYYETRHCLYEKFSLFVGHFNTRLTAYVIFLIGIDRYLNINPNLEIRNRLSQGIASKTGYKVMIIAVIVICAIQGCIPLIEFENRRLPDNLSAAFDSLIYFTYLIIYLRLYHKIKKFIRNNSIHSAHSGSIGYRSRYMKNLVKTVLYLLLTVGFCYMPYVAVKFITMYIRHGKGQELSRTWHFVHYLSFQPIIANSFFNTIIILNRNSVLKKYVFSIFPCLRSQIVSPNTIGNIMNTRQFDTTNNRRESAIDSIEVNRKVVKKSNPDDLTEIEEINRRRSKVQFLFTEKNAADEIVYTSSTGNSARP